MILLELRGVTTFMGDKWEVVGEKSDYSAKIGTHAAGASKLKILGNCRFKHRISEEY